MQFFWRGEELRPTFHALQRIERRHIEPAWILHALNNPVRVVEDPDVVSYYGMVLGHTTLLKVMVRRDDIRVIETVHFDTTATKRFQQGAL